MKKTIYIAALATITLCWACKDPGNKPVGPVEPENPASLWIMENDPLERVDVYVGKKLVESWTFDYDRLNRVTAMTRKDEIASSILYDLSYSYEGELEMTMTGNFTSSIKGTLNASVDEDDWNLVYSGDWDGAMEYRLAMDSDRPFKASYEYAFDASGNESYSSSVENSEKYDEQDGDILSVLKTISWKTTTDKVTSGSASSSIEIFYTYGEEEDLQNFGVWLMDCNFPVWFAKELPGCTHLITGMTMKQGNVVLPESFTVSYELNDNGSIKVATRTDYSRGEPVVERRYVFSYL